MASVDYGILARSEGENPDVPIAIILNRVIGCHIKAQKSSKIGSKLEAILWGKQSPGAA